MLHLLFLKEENTDPQMVLCAQDETDRSKLANLANDPFELCHNAGKQCHADEKTVAHLAEVDSPP